MAKFGFSERQLFYISDVQLEQVSSAPSVLSGQTAVYAKTDDLMYFTGDGASEQQFTVGGVNLGSSTANPDGADIFYQQNSSTAKLEFRRLISSQGTVNFTTSANEVDINVDLSDINDELDHGLLLGLADDDHLQYLLLAGRSGGQIAHGGTASGDDLELRSTSHATKGSVQIIDGSEFRHSNNHKQQYIVQTLNATPTTIATIALTDERVYQFKVMVVSRRSDVVGKRGAWDLQACAYRESAGSATLQGSIKQNFNNKLGAMDANISVSGNNVLVQVTGIAAETHEWVAYIEYLESN